MKKKHKKSKKTKKNKVSSDPGTGTSFSYSTATSTPTYPGYAPTSNYMYYSTSFSGSPNKTNADRTVPSNSLYTYSMRNYPKDHKKTILTPLDAVIGGGAPKTPDLNPW